MQSKLSKWISAATLPALVGGVLVISASAHIGGDVRPLETNGPDLESAQISTSDNQIVRYCFDETVAVASAVATDFSVEGYDDSDEDLGEAVASTSDNRCIEIDYDSTNAEAHLALDNYTQACSLKDAVDDKQASGNTENCVSLDRSTANGGSGATDGPDLVGADIGSSPQTIIYRFDEKVRCDTVTASSFGFYTSAGSASRQNGSTSAASCNDVSDPPRSDVTIEFTVGVSEAVRFFIEDGDVEDSKEADSTDGTFGSAGNDTDSPDLNDCNRVSTNQWDYEFDEDITTALNAADFWLYGDDRQSLFINPSTVSRQGDGSTVRATFTDPHIEEGAEDEEVPRCAVDEGAVVADVGGDTNTVGHAAAGSSPEQPGHSSGPDLEDVFIDEPSLEARFTYDEGLDPNSAVTCSSAYVIDDDGNKSYSSGGAAFSGTTHDCNFTSTQLKNAVGAGIDDQAVATDEGSRNGNQMAAIGRQVPSPSTTASPSASLSASPSPSASPSATPTTTTTTTTTPPDGGKRFPTNLTIRYNKKRGVFKGSVRSARRRCRSFRPVTLEGRAIAGFIAAGRGASNRKGKWRIPTLFNRGNFRARVARKVFTASNGDRVVCLSDRSATIKLRRGR